MSDYVGFVSQPNCGRGTIGIFWQCLTTIFLCAYTVLHFNVPVRPLSRNETWCRGLFWFTLSIFAPEIICGLAMQDYLSMKSLKRLARKHPGACLTTKQAFLVIARGVDLFIDGICFVPGITAWGVDQDGENIIVPEYGITVRFHNFINSLPTDVEIDSKAKTDFLGKLITIFQATWMASMIIARLVKGLLITPLEICSCAFVLLALLLCFLWWDKPYNIESGFAIHLESFTKANHANHHSPLTSVKDLEGLNLKLPPFALWDALGNDTWSQNLSTSDEVKGWLVITATGISFVATHAAAWNYGFPTLIEAWLWRGATVAMLVCLLAFPAAIWLGYGTGYPFWLLSFVTFPIYTIARLLVIFEMFAAFRSAPAGIYQDLSWTSYIGHVGG